MDGLELNLRFASKPNELNYCGPTCASSEFYQYLKEKKNREGIISSIKKFEALPIYLEIIAKKNNLNMFDYKVAESYWIGNELLDKFTISDLEELIDNLVKRGMLKSEGERLKSKLIKGFLPHHIFHVFFIEIGKISSKIEPLFKFKETCRPSYGKIKQIFEDKLIVIRTPIIFENNEYKLGLEEEKEIKYDKFLLPSLKCDDYVAIHWDVAVLKLNKKQVSNMEKYTNNFLKLINESYKK